MVEKEITSISSQIPADKIDESSQIVASLIRNGTLDVSDFCEFVMIDQHEQTFQQAEYHRIMHEFIDRGLEEGHRLFAIQSHMESGKTQQIIIARPLYEIGRNRNIRVGIASSVDALAVERVTALKTVIESNPYYRLTFPHIRPSSIWRSNYFTVERSISTLVDPTVRAGSLGTSVMGSRYDWLFFDDPCDDENSLYSAKERIKTARIIENKWLNRRAIGTGIVVWIGTPWHKEDAMHVITSRDEWQRLALPVRKDFKGVDVIINDTYIKTIPLWKERDEARLKRIRRENTEAVFNRGWHLIPFSDEEVFFKHFGRCVRYNADYKDFKFKGFIGGVDWATSKRPGTVLTLGGITEDNRKVLVDVRYLTDATRVELHLQNWLHNFSPIRCVYVENNGIQRILVDLLKQRGIVPIKGHLTGRNKWNLAEGLPALDVEFENGMWIIPVPHEKRSDCTCDICKFVNEFATYPYSTTNDGIMSFWNANSGMRDLGYVQQHRVGEPLDSLSISKGYGF